MSEKLKLEMLFSTVDKSTAGMKGIQKSARDLRKDFSETRKEMARLNEIQGQVNAFRALKKETGETSRKLGEAQDKVARLTAEMRRAGGPTKELTRELAAAKREAGGLKDKLDGQNQSLQRQRDRLKASGVMTRDLAKAQIDLKGKIAETSSKLDAQKGGLAKMGGGSAGGAPAGPGSTTDAAVKAGIIIATLKELSDIVGAPMIADTKAETAMEDIGQKANLSKAEVEKLRKELARLAPLVSRTPEELRSGIDKLSGFGMDPRNAIKVIEPIGRFVTAYRADMAEVSQATFAGIDNLKIPLDQTRKMLDIIAYAGKAGAFEAKDLAAALPAQSAAYQSLGQTGATALAQLAAGNEIARKGAGDSAVAGNNLFNLLNKLNSEETLKNFSEKGIDLQKALKASKDPLETIVELSKKATGGDLMKLNELFQDQQVLAALRPLMANMEEYRRIRDQALKAQGTMDQDFVSRADTTAAKWDAVTAKWNNMLEGAGQRLKPVTEGGIAVLDTLLTPTDEIKAKLDVKLQGIRDSLAKTRDGVIADLGKMAGSAKAESLRIGNSIGDGIRSGIDSAQARIKSSIEALGTMMPQWMRDKLGINSPSRVFMALAGSIPEGIARGIDGGAQQPLGSLARLNAGLTGAGIGGAGAASRGGAAQSVTYNTTIQLASAGDARIDAQAIKRELDRLHAIDARESYADG